MNKFTIRPKILKGESLSSYLLRLCNSNRIDIKDLLNDLYTNYKTIDLRNAHQIDINPIKTIDVNLLPNITKINTNYLNENTFCGLICKFISVEDIVFLNSTSTLIKELFTTRTRKFCSVCLQKSLTYKLIWQVNDILTCSFHNNPLSSLCTKCGNEQPYIHMNLAKGKCKYCDNSLTTFQKNILSDDAISYSNWLNNQWEYLNSLDLPKLKNDKEIIIRLFFIAGSKLEYFSINNIQQMNRDYAYKLLGVLSNRSSENYAIGINILFRLLWKLNYTIKEFFALDIPETFQNSIDAYLNKKSFIKCSTPWCNYNGSGDKLVKIKSLRSKTHNCLYLCLGCCIKYGINKECGRWEEYGDLVNFGYKIILPLINSGETRFHISKLTGLSRYKIYKITSYLARFNLIQKVHISDFIPENKTLASSDDLIKYADINETKMRINVQNNLKIGLSDFYYFYYDNVIQEYLCNI
ncbi:TniQ family protein [Bacillus sp. ISL-57]|uniref:TniQ family protein n=1 Tax=Bacillus sp. ISL-57 TaxID=2819135 RepID=UPI001BE6045C|nr:TniQ family protein [Bacillus sp. ISL-57]MBT2716954.1 TniQ family protein [Bacillus sp. ISL-57]